MKKTLLSNLTFILVGTIIALSASYAYATWGGSFTNTFTNPTGTAPANNVDSLLHVGTADQVKPVGSCAAGACGGLALGGSFVASKASEFDGTTFWKGIVGGGANGSFPANSMVYFGFAGNPTPITVSGVLRTATTLKSGLLASTDGNKKLCADDAGTVVFCDGTQSTMSSKRFYSITHFAEYDSSQDGILVGSVSGGNLPPYKAPNTPSNALPWVVEAGLYNGPSDCSTTNCSEWIFNDIPGVQPIAFTGGRNRLINVEESGSYHIIIHTSGKVGIKGKFDSSVGQLAIDLSLKINGVWNDFGDSTGKIHDAYPNPNHTKSEFDSSQTYGYSGDTSGGGPLDPFFKTGGNGNQFHYIPFGADFDKTIHLNKGDVVDVTADIYGYSRYEVKPGVNDYTNWNYAIQTNGATFDITETPDN